MKRNKRKITDDTSLHKTVEKIEELELETNEKVKSIEEKVVSDAKRVREVAKEEVNGFLDFIREKGVVGLAIGIIIGSAVTQTVNTLVTGLINPFIGLVLPRSTTLAEIKYHVGPEGPSQKIFEVGQFASTLLNLMVISAVIYFGVKWLKLDKLDKKKD